MDRKRMSWANHRFEVGLTVPQRLRLAVFPSKDLFSTFSGDDHCSLPD
jgi:hypothetical protein